MVISLFLFSSCLVSGAISMNGSTNPAAFGFLTSSFKDSCVNFVHRMCGEKPPMSNLNKIPSSLMEAGSPLMMSPFVRWYSPASSRGESTPYRATIQQSKQNLRMMQFDIADALHRRKQNSKMSKTHSTFNEYYLFP